MIEVLLYISKFSKKQQKDASPEQVTNFRDFSCENAETMTKFGLKVSVTPGERTLNGLSPLVSVGIRSLSGEPVPCPLMSGLPVGVR